MTQLPLFGSLDVAQRAILATMRDLGRPCTYTELQERCGLSGSASSDAFEALQQLGAVRQLPHAWGEQQMWEVVE